MQILAYQVDQPALRYARIYLQTKSNFNREFRRVTSLSPASWRERSRSEALAVVARVGAEDA
ncbi:hypothetical protein EN862_027085 [Mesorhizobium sp. M2E.F.Ca.ET.219.01.1.1]|nr:hypothetical protein EN862_027085 [Mesorhizobium sp. M2E.F.Ca.ET.219.01.1.1]